MRDLGDLFKIRDIELRIPDRFRIDSLGFGGNRLLNSRKIIRFYKVDLDPQPRERVVKEIVGSAVKIIRGNDLIPACAILRSAIVIADCPLETASAPTPPSRSAIRFSKTSVVGS